MATVDVSWQIGEKSGMWSIAEVGKRTGLSARTIRYYEEIGLLPGVRRSEAGRRVYADDELERLDFITRLKALGLSLGEIRELNAVHAIGGSTDAMLGHLRGLLSAHLEDVDRRLESLATLRDQLGAYHEHIERRLGDAGGLVEDAAPPKRSARAS